MSDKPLGILGVVAFAAPACVLCVAGPVAIASVFGGLAAWFSGSGWLAAIALVLAAALVARTIIRRRAKRKDANELPSGAARDDAFDGRAG